MRKLTIIFFSVFNLLLAPSLLAQNVTPKDILELYADTEWVKESQLLTQVTSDAVNIIHYQHSQQSEIQKLVISYLETDQLTHEELWENLDNILSQTDIHSENLNTQVNNLQISSSSSSPTARWIHKESLELIYDLNDYSIENNKLTKDLIGHLDKEEVEKYDYKVGRSYMLNADFLELMAKSNRSTASILPAWNLGKVTLVLESQVLEYQAIATRVNGHQILGELDKSLLRKYKNPLDRKYKIIKQGDSYGELLSSIDLLNNIKKEIQSIIKKEIRSSPKETANLLVEVIDRLTISAKLYSEANLRNAHLWKEIMDFYYKNPDYLGDLFSDNLRNAEFINIQTRQEFIIQQMSNYANEYAQATIEFTQVFPRLLSLTK